MINYWRNWTKSAEAKRQEALNAYLDDALSPRARRRFEQLLAEDAALQAELAQRQVLKAQLRQLPRRRVPRNFMLDPAVYGRPQRQPLFRFYPAMRTAAVLTAFFFILSIGASLFLPEQGGASFGGAAAQDVALMVEEAEAPAEMAAETIVTEGETVEVTRVVTETVVEVEAAVEAMAVEESAEEAMAEDAAAEEFAAEEPMAAEAPALAMTEPAADVDGAGAPAETAAALPTPSPAPTAIAVTKSTAPRPAAATGDAARAVTAVPTPLPQNVPERDNAAVVAATAVPPAPEPRTLSVSPLGLMQIGLGVLLVVLGTAVIYVRRQTF